MTRLSDAAAGILPETPTSDYAERMEAKWLEMGCAADPWPHVAIGLLLSCQREAWTVFRALVDGPLEMCETFACPLLREIAEALVPLAASATDPTDDDIRDALTAAQLLPELPMEYFVVLMTGALREWRAWKPAQAEGERQRWRFAEEVFFRCQFARAEVVDERRDSLKRVLDGVRSAREG